MHKGEEPRCALPHHVVAQSRKHRPAGATGIHGRGDARRQTKCVGVAKSRLIAVKKMAVDIDQPRSYELTRDIYGFARFAGRNIFGQRRNHAVAEGDIATTAKLAAGIDDFAVFEQ